MSKSHTFLFFVLLVPALVVGCGETQKDPNPAQLRTELSQEFHAIDSPDKRPPDFEAKLDRFLTLDPNPVDRVWVISQQIDLGRENNQLEAMPTHLHNLHEALESLAEGQGEHGSLEWCRGSAESTLRFLHKDVYERWVGGKDEHLANIITTAGEMYWHHFPDAIAVADVLWVDAEFRRQNGQPMEAVSYYERILVKDFHNTYGDDARSRIIDAWTAASYGAELPTDLKEAVPIPSPHKEWMEIVGRTIKKDPTSQEAREYLFRIAKLKLAFAHTEEAEAELMELAFSKEDDVAVEAASFLLEHEAKTYDTKYNFRKLRKTLQENKYLWSRSEFRSVYFRLKKEVEGD